MAVMEKLFQVSVQWVSFTLKCHLSINCCFYMCRKHVMDRLLTELTRQDVGLCHHWFFVMSHASVPWFCCYASLLGFVVKSSCFLE